MKAYKQKQDAIRQLAGRTLKAEHVRNLFAVLTISLAACMILVVALYFTGTMQAVKKDLKTRYQVYYTGVNAGQLEALKQDPSVALFGEMLLNDSLVDEDYELRLQYIDEGLASLSRYEWASGGLPRTEEEIAVEEGYLLHTGQSLKTGESVVLPNGETFRISGIVKSTSESRIFSTLISKEYALRHGSHEDGYSVYLKLADSDDYSEDELRQEAAALAQKHGIDTQSMGFSSYYLLNMDIDSGRGWRLSALLFSLVGVCSGLVVYSVFYVSVISKMNEYGRLKTLGTTQRQLSHLVRLQADRLTLTALVIALPLGNAVAYLMLPDGYQWPNALFMSMTVALLCWLTVCLAVARPAQMAARVTPVEALRYTAAAGSNARPHRPIKRITPWSLACLNLTRNRKKALLTLCSLSVCGILLLASAAYLDSLDVMELARRDYPYGDLTVMPADGVESFGEGELSAFQQRQIYDEEFEAAILSLDGVEQVKRYRGLQVKWQFPSGLEEPQVLDGLTREEARSLEKGLISGAADSLFNQENTFWLRSPATYQEVYHWSPQVGDQITIRLDDGTSRCLSLAGIIEEASVYGGGLLYISEDLMKALSTEPADLTYQLSVSTQPDKTDAVEEQLRVLCAPYPDLRLLAVKDYAAQLEGMLDQQKAPIYVLVAMIGAFGLINLVNTLMTNLISRKRELAGMQALGLSGRQMQSMLMKEGLLYSGGAIACSLLLGSVCGVALCRLMVSFGTFGAPSYHFPLPAFTAFAGLLVLAQIVFSILSTRFYQKESLVERMRAVE